MSSDAPNPTIIQLSSPEIQVLKNIRKQFNILITEIVQLRGHDAERFWRVNFQEDVLEAAYLGSIQNTQDLQTGDFINSFTFSSGSSAPLIVFKEFLIDSW